MPENEIETPEVEETTSEVKPDEAEAAEEETKTEEIKTEDGGDELPDWAREKLTKANAEAANYRTKLRDAEQKLADAKTPEQVEEILAQWKVEREEQERKDADEAHALLIENIALKYKLPEKLANRLQGSTREELEADAKELASEFGQDDDEDFHLEGGLSPRHRDSDPDDPRALARKYSGKRR